MMKRKRPLSKASKQRIAIVGVFVVLVFAVIVTTILVTGKKKDALTFLDVKQIKQVPQRAIETMLLEPNPYSRPQKELKEVKGVVIHYTANPGTDAMDNRDYFNNLRITKRTYVSSHYIIGLDGTVVQCIPLNEIAYASNQRNEDTISIECCHPKKNGKFTKETYQSLVELTAWLCGEYQLDKDDVIRHYDVTGKDCPKYYVKHEEKWEAFKEDVMKYLDENNIHDAAEKLE